MMTCTNCGAQIAPGKRFCASCGATAPQQQQYAPQPTYQQPAAPPPPQPTYQQPAPQPPPQPMYQQPAPQPPQPTYQQPAAPQPYYGAQTADGGTGGNMPKFLIPVIAGFVAVALLVVVLFVYPGVLMNNDNNDGPEVIETDPNALTLDAPDFPQIDTPPAIETPVEITPTEDPTPDTPIIPPLATIPGSGGTASVDGKTEYSFTPDTSGQWRIYTSNSTGDPYLWLHDQRGNFLSENDDYEGGSDSLISYMLEAGSTYNITAGFYDEGTGSYTLTVELASASSAPGPGSTSGSANMGNGGNGDGIAWWDGCWYGAFSIHDAGEYYSDFKDTYEDAHAVIVTNPNGTATMHLWSDGFDIGTVELSIDVSSGRMGVATVTSGRVFGLTLSAGAWQMNPQDVESQLGLLDTFAIGQEHMDSDGDWFKWMLIMRPWGARWDDFSESARPPYYADWYIGQGKINQPMLEALGSDGINHSIVSEW